MTCAEETQVSAARLLVADDQPHILAALDMLLRERGYEVKFAATPADVLQTLHAGAFDAVVMDLNYTRDTTGGGEGLELVSRIHAIDETLPLLVMTAWSSVDLAVEAMRRGASDFVQKPWDNRELLQKVHEQVQRCRARRRAQRRQEEESREAREIQDSLMPRVIPQVAGYDISARTQSARFVGGDYFDVQRIDDTRTAFCIADAAGKGMPGALLMSNLQAALKPLIHEGVDPREACKRLNRALCEVMPAHKFISLFYGVLDSGRNRLTYCNAGHNPPLLVRANGETTELASSGAVLGYFPDWDYAQSEVELRRGDILLLFTDGVVEAESEAGEPFGEHRLLEHARAIRVSEAAGLQEALLKKVSEHCRGHFQDDATMIVLRAKN